MQNLTIAELVALTGVPSATVHYYLRNGLLPMPARVAPNRFAYDERHVQGLRLIRTLRERRRLSLPMIKRILPDLLRLEATEAFLPEMWDRALAPRLARRARPPSTRLLEAAKEAFAARGYDAVNVDEICRAARIAKGSFYRHYRSKELLFFAAAESAAADAVTLFREALGEPPSEQEPRRAAQGGERNPGALLARFLQPRLPIFLDLLEGAVQRRPSYQSAARRILSAAVTEVGASLGAADPAEVGLQTVGSAMGLVFGQVAGFLGTDGPDLSTGPPDGEHVPVAGL
jgi:AcrR family transcriptional regulator